MFSSIMIRQRKRTWYQNKHKKRSSAPVKPKQADSPPQLEDDDDNSEQPLQVTEKMVHISY